MKLDIAATELEKEAIIAAIRKLNAIRHLNYMSQTMIAEESGVKQSKVRIGLQDLVDAGFIEQIHTNGDKQVKRYYYIITDSGTAKYPIS